MLGTGLTLAMAFAAPVPASAAGGHRQWVARYEKGRNATARALVVSPDGSTVFVTGEVSRPGVDEYGTVAYDAATGVQRWFHRYNGSRTNTDQPNAIAVSPDGSLVYVTGESLGTTTGFDYATVAYRAATGAQAWVRRYDGPTSTTDLAFAVAVSPDGSAVFVTGTSEDAGGGPSRYATVAYDAHTGSRLWVRRYGGPVPGEDSAAALGVAPDGSMVYVTGQSDGNGTGEDFATVAYEASTGRTAWVRRYDDAVSGDDGATQIGVSADGSRVFVSGQSDSTSGIQFDTDYATVAYDAKTGGRIWVSRFGGRAHFTDRPTGLGLNADGSRVFVTGVVFSEGTTAAYGTVAYDAATGAREWTRVSFKGEADSFANAGALAVSPDGTRVVVTGDVAGVSADYGTVAYDAATGATQWARRYDGPAHGYDSATAVGMSPDGTTTFVTGNSIGTARGYDYATVAYDTS
jgi:WD40 repeat protein